MEVRVLGATGMRVSPLCLGTMMFGPMGNNDRGDCVRIIHRAFDAGINFLDTAEGADGEQEADARSLVGCLGDTGHDRFGTQGFAQDAVMILDRRKVTAAPGPAGVMSAAIAGITEGRQGRKQRIGG